MPVRDIDLTSPLLPGGTFVRAIFDRVLMQVSDRGGASGLIGARWADLCDAAMRTRIGQPLGSASNRVPRFTVERVVRLDDIPAIAAAASSLQLQNPDFLVIGRYDGVPVIQAADAKFSVETARTKQVSREVVAALARLGPLMTNLLDLDLQATMLVPGIFLCPDFNLTHLMLERRAGILRTTVSRSEILLLPVVPADFNCGLDDAGIMPLLHRLDGLPASLSESLLAAIYYFRVARACICCWVDETGPLLAHNDPRIADREAVQAAVSELRSESASAYDLFRRWMERARSVQAQRAVIDQATALPISGKELRAMSLRAVAGKEAIAPSVNRIRRPLAAWHRAALRQMFGPVMPPIADFDAVVQELAAASRDQEAGVRAQAERIIQELIVGRP